MMKLPGRLLIPLFLAASPAAAQTVPGGQWLFTLRPAGGGELVVRLAVEPAGAGRWRAFSRPGAAGELVGWPRATLGRLLGKLPPRGALVRVENGTATARGDQLLVTGRLVALSLGERTFSGVLADGRMHGELRRISGSPAGTFEAVPAADPRPVRDYRALAARMRDSVAARIYDPALLDRPEWRSFFRELDARFASVPDDVHAMAVFYALTPRLRMSHLELFRDPRIAATPLDSLLADDPNPDALVGLSFPAPGVARLRAARWSGVTSAVDRAFVRIDSAAPHTLILDIRGNPGGDVSSMSPVTHLVRDSLQAGVFLGPGWYRTHRAPPTSAELAAIPVLSDGGAKTVIHGVRRHGALRGVVPPRAPYFGGRVFLLVDGRSGSASEPLAHLLKTTGRATLVGERTAGGMLSAPPHPVGDGWVMIFPEADYFAADGTRLEGNGVRPHVAVASDRALATVAERIGAEHPYAGALLLGTAHLEANRLPDAERWFGEALRLAPDSIAPVRGLALVHGAGKQWSAAFALWDRVLARDSGDLSALYHTGRMAALSGERLESGERALRAYLARAHRADLPSHAAAHWRLGMILQARGDVAGARREYGSALRLDPQHADAQAALRALNDRGPS
jgi:hypothetical protein